MVRYKIEYGDIAKSDLRGIHNYIAEQALRPRSASKQIKLIKDKIANLSFMPQKCPFVDMATSPYRMRFVKKKYVVIYLIYENKKLVYIYRVFNTKQNWRNLLR